jgi:hypothetical protein
VDEGADKWVRNGGSQAGDGVFDEVGDAVVVVRSMVSDTNEPSEVLLT